MRMQEAQRRILDVLLWASDQGVMSDDEVLAEELGVDKRIVLGNLQLLEEVGYVKLTRETQADTGIEVNVELTPKGYVLLHEPDEEPASMLPLARAMLAVMERQVAGFGALYAPPYLIVQLEEQRRRVARLEAEQAGPE